MTGECSWDQLQVRDDDVCSIFLMAVYCVGFEQGNILSSPTWGLEMVPYQSRSIDRVRV